LRAAGDHPDAFCEVYTRYFEDIFGWFRRRVESDGLALDLTAETFAQALSSLRRFRDEAGGSARPWLYGIAEHLFYKYERRRRVETKARRRLGLPVRHEDAYEDLEDRLDAIALQPSLSHAVDALPQRQREALKLRVVEGHSYREVARRMATSEASARKRVYLALRALRARFQGGSDE
jgi:RNA polymerase sigma-70 factor (ECF subfamily)